MILVTGASGNVGREVVRVLRARGAAVRETGRAGVPLDFSDAATFTPALEGCEAVFLLRPPAVSDVRATLIPFVDRARELGAKQIVFLSVAGAETNTLVPHHAVERHLVAGPPTWTILRPGFFAQNLQDAYRRDIVEDDRLYVPAGRGKAAFVDVRDVAEVAASALLDPDAHAGKGYTLTGPEAIAFDDAARILSEVLGRTIRYEPASVPRYAVHLRRRGMPLAQIAVQTVLHVGLRFGQAERVDPTLERLLGRPGGSLRRYVEDHASTWAK